MYNDYRENISELIYATYDSLNCPLRLLFKLCNKVRVLICLNFVIIRMTAERASDS